MDRPRGKDEAPHPGVGGTGGGPQGQGPRDADPGEQESAHLVPIEDHIDLHAFRPRDVPEVVRDYLDEAAARGFREVRVIHGRGTGFQRERVRAVLAAHPLVESFADAPPQRGHWGATLVRLRGPG